MTNKKSVLFVCVENSNRSQMAEAFARILGGEKIEAYSAGSNPSGVINPKAIQYMSELGYDMSTHQSTALADLPDRHFDFVATMGCGDECPFIKTTTLTDWAVTDPKHLDADGYRAVRDEIRDRVSSTLKNIGLTLQAD